MGYILKLKNGKFQARERRKGQDTSQVFATEKDAERWLKRESARIEKASSGAGSINSNTFSVGEAILYYFEHHIKGTKSSDTTRLHVANLPTYLLNARVKTLARETVDRYVTGLLKEGKAAATVHRRLNILRACVNYCSRHEPGLEHCANVFALVKRPKLPQSASRTRIATADELDALARATGSMLLTDFIELSLETACRRGELAGLRFEHCDFAKSVAMLYDTKNGTDRQCPLSPRALEILRRRQEEGGESGFVFESPKRLGEPIEAASISRAFRRARAIIERETGQPMGLRLHDLRHTAATRYADAGFDVFSLKSITGHKDIRSLDRYVNKQAEIVAKKMAQLEKATDNILSKPLDR